MEVNRRVTLDVQYSQLVSTGRIAGIDPQYRPGDRDAHHIFWDSDVAKWIESAAYSLRLVRDAALEARIDEVVDEFEKCQCSDGYLNSWYTAVEPAKRWTNLRDCHEMYCAGHLIEAAVAYYLATGRRKLLDIVCKYADHIDSTFGSEDGKRRGYCGHEEIELALVKLFAVTGNERYLRLASYMVDERGRRPHYYDLEAEERGEHPTGWHHGSYEYCQAHEPVRSQMRVVGHAVRAMYLYCGMADVARLTGDESLLTALEALWEDVCLKQMYVIGGIGPSSHNEGFTAPYDMPEESAYCETCAAVGLAFWNHRMLQLTGDSRYADILERALYNGAISGVSLDGDRFFYVNPSASLGGHHRQEWFGCACCPGNISRLIASIGGYVYSSSDVEPSVWVHLYIQGSGEMTVCGKTVVLRQKTTYPWEGRIELAVGVEEPMEFTLALRIPDWCRESHIAVNGEEIRAALCSEKGYVKVRRTWQKGDIVVIDMAMSVERVIANPAVRQANGKVALQMGPVVYCLESIDNCIEPLSRIALPREAELQADFEPMLLGGVVTISARAFAMSDDGWAGKLYGYAAPKYRPVNIKAVPYAVWDNREAGQMIVWIREM